MQASASGSVRASVPSTAPDQDAQYGVDAGAPDAQAELAIDAEAFLVLRDDGALVLEARSGSTRVLAPRADAALHQAAFDLLWFRDGPQLKVLDLRRIGGDPILVATGLPGINRLAVAHPTQPVETEDGCDLDLVTLTWSDVPTIEAAFSRPAGLRIENRAWLQAEQARASHMQARRTEFGSAHVRIPNVVLRCEDKQSCAASVPFSASELALVLVRETTGGDCFHRACLLYDPRTKLFASPLEPQTWGRATEIAPGPCGLYKFDRERTGYLIADRLCALGKACVPLGGHALGWLAPGDLVGRPGIWQAAH